VLIVDAHLDLAMNGVLWNRDLASRLTRRGRSSGPPG
jgi:hypothetical protein